MVSFLYKKYKTDSGDKHVKNMHFITQKLITYLITSTFRILVNIHFKKYNRYNFFGKRFILQQWGSGT